MLDNYIDKEELLKIRRYLHQNPELSGEEYKTADFLREKLKEYGIKYDVVDNTGTVAVIEGEKAGKTVLIRADIDALPVLEDNDLEFKSKNDGVMHACGHDIHTACGIYTAKVLNELKNTFDGTVKVVFQPKEETDGGAEKIIQWGVMENPKVDACFAIHVEPLEECGKIQIKDGAIMASPDDFEIEIIGKGGHGATPEECINPITVGAEIVEKINNNQEYKRKDSSIVSVCEFLGGTCYNVIPDKVKILGTARSLSEGIRQKLKTELTELVDIICKKYGAKYNFTFNFRYPPTINSKNTNEIVINAAKKIDKIKGITYLEHSSMCGDDFSYFARLVPSSYFRLGVGNEGENHPIHSPKFIANEDALEIGVEILVQSTLDYLNS